MDDKIEFFENGDFKFITNLVEEKFDVLKKCEDFNKQYLKLFDTMEELDVTLEDKQRQIFNEIVKLFYNTEQYYFALAYSLGVKYGNDLEKL